MAHMSLQLFFIHVFSVSDQSGRNEIARISQIPFVYRTRNLEHSTIALSQHSSFPPSVT